MNFIQFSQIISLSSSGSLSKLASKIFHTNIHNIAIILYSQKFLFSLFCFIFMIRSVLLYLCTCGIHMFLEGRESCEYTCAWSPRSVSVSFILDGFHCTWSSQTQSNWLSNHFQALACRCGPYPRIHISWTQVTALVLQALYCLSHLPWPWLVICIS